MAIKTSKCAYVVGCDDRYLPGLTALLNSLDMVGNRYDVLVSYWKIPNEYMIEMSSKMNYKIIWDPITQAEVDWLGDMEVLMRKRYAIPHTVLYDYDAVCILDADMFFVHNVDRYMEISAKTDLIQGCQLEQKRRYDHEHHTYPFGSGTYLIDPQKTNLRDIACAPLFAGRRWFSAMAKAYQMVNNHSREEGRFRAPDMDAINIVLIEAGAYDYIIPMTQVTWTGLHESLMKAHTRLIDMHGQAFTEDGQEVNIIHGKPWIRKWRDWQVEAQVGMIEREFNASASYISRSKGSFENIIRLWKQAARDHKVDAQKYWKYELMETEHNDGLQLPNN